MGKKVSMKDAADEWGVSLSHVRRMISDGKLRAYRVGRATVRIDADDLAEAMVPIVPAPPRAAIKAERDRLTKPVKADKPLPRRRARRAS